MDLIETKKCYKVFTKNDRCVGTVVYQEDAGSSGDIVFRPFFHQAGDPWIGALSADIESDQWQTSEELFGKYLHDPDFKIGCPTIHFQVCLDIKAPEWMGDIVIAFVDFENDGFMACRYGAEKAGLLLGSNFPYQGEINLAETSVFARTKLEEDQKRVEFFLSRIPPMPVIGLNFFDDEDDDDDEDDEE